MPAPALSIVRNENPGGTLSPTIIDGLTNLRFMDSPAGLFDQENWATIIHDAERLVMDNWAAQAVGLGWEPIELFGFGHRFDGLASWLEGRKLILLDNARALAIGRGGERAVYKRTDPAGAVMLWNWRELPEPDES